MDKRAAKLEITSDRVLQEIAKIAFMDPRKFFNSDGSAKQITELDDDTAMELAGMEVVELKGGQRSQPYLSFSPRVGADWPFPLGSIVQ
jgi:phage terminase small subunit